MTFTFKGKETRGEKGNPLKITTFHYRTIQISVIEYKWPIMTTLQPSKEPSTLHTYEKMKSLYVTKEQFKIHL